MSTQHNREQVERWVASAWNRGDFSLAADMYAPGYRLHDPGVPGGVIPGIDGLQAMIGTYRTALSPMTFVIDAIAADHDLVCWRWTARGLNQGPLMDIPPSGHQVEVSGIVMSRFENGRWAEDWVHWDRAGLLAQIGALAVAP